MLSSGRATYEFLVVASLKFCLEDLLCEKRFCWCGGTWDCEVLDTIEGNDEMKS